jgi:formylglycine-generating enzyme required for sulfatase activity
MPDSRNDPIAKLKQTLVLLEEQQRSLNADLSPSIAPLRQLLAQLEGAPAIVNAGAGAIALDGGVAAGQDGVAVGHNVLGDVLINSIKIIYAGHDAQHMQAAQSLLRRYLRQLADDCAPLKLKAIDQGAARPGQQPLGLTSVYVDLNVDLRIPSDTTLAAYLSAARQHERMAEKQETRQVSVLEALAHHPRLVLLGKPGSGKSTLSAYLALSLAQAGLGDATALKRLGAEWTHGPLLPVRVILRQFAASLPADLERGRAAQLWKFMGDELVNSGLPPDVGLLLQNVAAESGALFLLDGLDEAGDETRRARVMEAVTEFMRTAGSHCRFVLTARPYAWEEPTSQHSADGLAVYRLDDFDSTQIETFIVRWYQAIAAIGWVSATEANQKTADLQPAVQRADLLPLARNPLLLTLMATLHSNRTRLPDDRADLYHEVVELLLQRWNETVGADRGLLDALKIPDLKLANLREVIEQLAFDAHAANVGKTETADISEATLLEAFCPLLGNSLDKARLVVDYIERRAGLMLGQGPRERMRQFTFPHRTFQEFLAACYLQSCDDWCEQAVQLAYDAPGHWREVLVLAARQAKKGRGVPVADALVHAQSYRDYVSKGKPPEERDWRAAILAGAQLLEIGLAAINSVEAYSVVRERVASWLVALIETPRCLPLPERIEAGNTLGRLGDPRFPVRRAADGTCYILPPLVRVEAGPFEMGSNKGEPLSDNDEYSDKTKDKRHRVDVAAFDIARYPVTNAEYHCFVVATDYAAPKHWRNGKVPPGLENHPVVNVSWHDTRQYCKWLSSVSRKAVRLPTEAEWEKAARWDKVSQVSRVYPWSDEWDPDRCNTWEAGPHETTPVGIYPDGTSPSGLLDAAGNVWEWCQSKKVTYPYKSDDGDKELSGDAGRVVRGGSWYLDRVGARCACRNDYHPDGRGGRLGFRVVVVSPGSRS